ncbi:MAG: tryptophan synthase subunit alpha [Verrucomicrobia bacterium]|nr:MAG: tryptophan synthase subunit alpha [Verrucomicrobiota bacterium]
MQIATRIETRFQQLRAKGQKGFIAYLTGGDPNLAATEDIILRLEDAGVDVIELGVPFSDPLADGPVIQEASTRALANGATWSKLMAMLARLRRRSEVPLLLFSYLNPLLVRGFARTARDAAAAGADGFLMLDLPVEEAAKNFQTLENLHLNHIGLVTPTSPPERIKKIVAASSGFVYCVSREGVTGMQQHLAPGAVKLVAATRRLTKLPVALGFGIATPEHAAAAVKAADAVVVGSAIVDRFHRAPHTPTGRAAAARWVGTLVRAVKQV